MKPTLLITLVVFMGLSCSAPGKLPDYSSEEPLDLFVDKDGTMSHGGQVVWTQTDGPTKLAQYFQDIQNAVRERRNDPSEDVTRYYVRIRTSRATPFEFLKPILKTAQGMVD